MPTVQRQMGFWHPPISGLQCDNSTDAHDPGARLAALCGHLGLRSGLYSHLKPLIDHLVSRPIRTKAHTGHVLSNAVPLTKDTTFSISTFNPKTPAELGKCIWPKCFNGCFEVLL